MSVRRTLLALIVLTGCTTSSPRMIDSARPQLAVREYQTRTYETTDTAMVMKAVLNALQDEGFIIKNANDTLGLITARKEESKPPCFLPDTCATLVSWDSSVNVSAFGSQTKVRVNVQQAGQTITGHVLYSTVIDDPTYYQSFFAKVDKSVFIQKEKL